MTDTPQAYIRLCDTHTLRHTYVHTHALRAAALSTSCLPSRFGKHQLCFGAAALLRSGAASDANSASAKSCVGGRTSAAFINQ